MRYLAFCIIGLLTLAQCVRLAAMAPPEPSTPRWLSSPAKIVMRASQCGLHAIRIEGPADTLAIVWFDGTDSLLIWRYR